MNNSNIQLANFRDKGFRLEGARVAIYGRVSTKEQAISGLSIPAQKASLNRFVDENGMKIVDYYFDEGVSGTSLKRSELQRLLNDVKAGKIDIIIFTKLDRWMRSTQYYHNVQSILDEYNVQWKAIFESYDTFTANGQFEIGLRLLLNELEVKKTKERINEVFQYMLNNNQPVSGSMSLGYKIEKTYADNKVVNSKIVIDEATVHVVHFVFDKYEELQSLGAVAKELENIGYPRTIKSVGNLLRNKKYVGHYEIRGTVYEEMYPKIIEEEQFNRVQNLLNVNISKYDARSSSTLPRDFIFRKLIKCPKCGGVMTGSNKKLAHTTAVIYRCSKVTTSSRQPSSTKCNYQRTVREDKIEKIIFDQLKPQLQEFTIIVKDKQSKEPKIDRKKLERKLKNIKELYMNADISKEEYTQRSEEIKKLLDRPIEKQVDDLEKLREKFAQSDFEKIYWSLGPLEKRSLYASIVSDIELLDQYVPKLNFL